MATFPTSRSVKASVVTADANAIESCRRGAHCGCVKGEEAAGCSSGRSGGGDHLTGPWVIISTLHRCRVPNSFINQVTKAVRKTNEQSGIYGGVSAGRRAGAITYARTHPAMANERPTLVLCICRVCIDVAPLPLYSGQTAFRLCFLYFLFSRE